MKPLRLVILIASILLLAGTLPDNQPSYAQTHYCGDPTECINSDYVNTCIKTATSLPAINLQIAGDWYIDRPNSHCGARKCYFFMACECGPPLSSRLCTSGEKVEA